MKKKSYSELLKDDPDVEIIDSLCNCTNCEYCRIIGGSYANPYLICDCGVYDNLSEKYICKKYKPSLLKIDKISINKPKEIDKKYFKWINVTDFSNIIPEEPGCYAIFQLNIDTWKSRLLYIGTAQNLSQRLKRHEVRKVLYAVLEYPNLVQIKVKVIRDKQKRLYTESYLIRRLKPPINSF